MRLMERPRRPLRRQPLPSHRRWKLSGGCRRPAPPLRRPPLRVQVRRRCKKSRHWILPWTLRTPQRRLMERSWRPLRRWPLPSVGGRTEFRLIAPIEVGTLVDRTGRLIAPIALEAPIERAVPPTAEVGRRTTTTTTMTMTTATGMTTTTTTMMTTAAEMAREAAPPTNIRAYPRTTSSCCGRSGSSPLRRHGAGSGQRDALTGVWRARRGHDAGGHVSHDAALCSRSLSGRSS